MIPNKIILHHSLTKDSGTVSWLAIRDYHINTNGWREIGYNFGLELITDTQDRSAYEILLGRMPNETGAHCVGQNSNSIGICFIGNFDIDHIPTEQWNQGLKLCNYLLKQYSLKPQDVYGHRDFAEKTCPGLYFDMDKFRNDLGNYGKAN